MIKTMRVDAIIYSYIPKPPNMFRIFSQVLMQGSVFVGHIYPLSHPPF